MWGRRPALGRDIGGLPQVVVYSGGAPPTLTVGHISLPRLNDS